MKAVLDVGQFVSSTINSRGHPSRILRAWRNGDFDLVTAYTILEDLRRALFYPYIRKRHRWTDQEIRLFVELIGLTATITSGEFEIDVVVADATDNKIVACAVEGQVDYIVVSDEHLTSLGSFSGIPIVPPRQFLNILERSGCG